MIIARDNERKKLVLKEELQPILNGRLGKSKVFPWNKSCVFQKGDFRLSKKISA